jgi:uncharacterized protein YhaN
MHIERVHIDGYGIFHDFTLDELSPRATVLVGPNESGKTTLLSFIRTILCGFLTKQQSVNLYEPLAGGRHGGRIFLTDDRDEAYVVERFAGPKGGALTLTLPSGAPGGATDLADLLGHASRDLFRNVFAFSLAELQTFETLRNEDVRTRIYGAGLGAGRLDLPEIEKKVQQEREKLFKEGGKAQTVAKLIHDAEEARARLRALAGQVAEHDRLHGTLESLSRDIEQEREERRTQQAEISHISNLSSAWDDWTELQSARERLEELPQITQFPTDGMARLESFLQQQHSLEERIEELQGDISRAEQEMQSIEVDRRMLDQAAEIEGLKRGLDRYQSARDGLPRRQSELDADLDALKEDMRNLGPDWDEARVREFDTSLPAREAVRGFGKQLEDSAGRLHDAELNAEHARQNLEEARAEHGRLEQALKQLGEPPQRDRGVLDERRSKLRDLRGLLSAHATSQERLKHLEERKGDLSARIEWLERQVIQRIPSLPAWPAVALPLGGGAVAAVLAVPLGWVAALVAAVIGLIAGLAYAGLRIWLKTRAGLDLIAAELETLRGQWDGIEKEASAVDSEAKKEGESMERLAQELGFDGTPDIRDLNVADDALEKDVETLREWQDANQRVTEAAQRVEELEERVQKAEEGARRAESHAQKAKSQWTEWLDSRAIEVGTSPDTCLELLSGVDTLRGKIKAVDGLRTRIGAIEKALLDLEERTNLVRQACGRQTRERSGFPGAVDELIEASNTARQDSERVQQLQEQIETAATKKKTRETAATEVETGISGLLSEAGAADQEDFRRRAVVFAERVELLQALRERRKNLERIGGRDRALQAFMKELETADPEQLHQAKLEAEEGLVRIEEELAAKGREQGQVIEQIRQLESEEKSSELRLQLSVLREKISVEAGKWSVLTIAKAMLEETRLKYERERQPAVIQEAQTFFSSFTTGRYARIFSLPGENRIEVEDQTGERKDIPELSRATAEQLYLALRFGLVREFARRAEPLPVVMDDILVNFDPDRAREACRAIGELSKHQQVLLFTCHPETVDLLRSEVQDCRVIQLQLQPG